MVACVSQTSHVRVVGDGQGILDWSALQVGKAPMMLERRASAWLDSHLWRPEVDGDIVEHGEQNKHCDTKASLQRVSHAPVHVRAAGDAGGVQNVGGLVPGKNQ